MKKLSILFLSVVALTATFTSCSKDEAKPAPVAATSIEVTVFAPDGTTPLVGTTVQLFDANDSSQTVISSGTTDSSGKYIFDTNLSSKTYVVVATTAGGDAGCKTNYKATSGAIPLNKKTTLTITTIAKGSVQFVNKNATNACNLYVQKTDGSFSAIITTPLGANGGTTQQSIVAVGTYTFKSVLVDDSGAEITGSDVLHTTTVTECNNNEVDIN